MCLLGKSAGREVLCCLLRLAGGARATTEDRFLTGRAGIRPTCGSGSPSGPPESVVPMGLTCSRCHEAPRFSWIPRWCKVLCHGSTVWPVERPHSLALLGLELLLAFGEGNRSLAWDRRRMRSGLGSRLVRRWSSSYISLMPWPGESAALSSQ